MYIIIIIILYNLYSLFKVTMLYAGLLYGEGLYETKIMCFLCIVTGRIRPGCGSPLAGSETDCSREWNRDPRTLHRRGILQKPTLQTQHQPGTQ